MSDFRLTKKKNTREQLIEKINSLDKLSFMNNAVFGEDSSYAEYGKMKVNYDLFNNKINKEDFEHVCAPFGSEVGELPADFTNKDIISGKVKALLGMEIKRPFSWRVIAVNDDATTRIEEEETKRLKEYVTNMIMTPIRQQIEKERLAEMEGKELSPEEEQQLNQQIEQELKAMTPKEIKVYMERVHQDPQEILATQILNYFIEKDSLKAKFNEGWKHGLISGKEIFWTGIINKSPIVKVINPLRFDHDRTNLDASIQKGEWATYQMYMTPSEITKYFIEDLTDMEIDKIFEDYETIRQSPNEYFTFDDTGISEIKGIRVMHAEWKGLKEIGILTTLDLETGEQYEMIVEPDYKLNKEVGDINLIKDYALTVYEGYKIGEDIYALVRERPGRNLRLDNMYDVQLSYIGRNYDSVNSETTSIVDRMKYWQYLYNIITYRIELLTAADEGKKLLLNLNLIPKTSGISVEKWMHYFTANKIGFMDPNEAGNKTADITQAAKEVDMSLVSDIQRYIELASYIERRAGDSVGITKQIEGQVNSGEAVRNTQVAIAQSSAILEPYFEIHNLIKRDVLLSFLEVAKTAFQLYQPKKLSYILDDMTRKMLDVDQELLESAEYGVFVSNSMKSFEALQMVQQLSHAALQNQTAELSDVLKVLKANSLQEAEEQLRSAETARKEREQAMQESAQKAQAEAEDKAREFKREEWAFEMKKMQEEERLKTEREIRKQLILSMGFNEDKDIDKDGVPDILEILKVDIDKELKSKKQALDEKKFAHQKEVDNKKLQLEDKKLKQNNNKNKDKK